MAKILLAITTGIGTRGLREFNPDANFVVADNATCGAPYIDCRSDRGTLVSFDGHPQKRHIQDPTVELATALKC